MKVKICFITSTIFNLGGVQRVLSVVASELSKFHDVDILCTDNSYEINRELYDLELGVNVIFGQDLIKKNFFQKALYGVIKKINFKTGFLNNKKNINTLTEIYYPKKIQDKFIDYLNKKNYDIVIGVEGIYSLLLGIISDKLNSKTIGWQHNSYDAYLDNKNKYYWNLDELFKQYIPQLNKYIVLTEYDKEKFKEKMGIESTVIYNPLSFKSNIKSQLKDKSIIFVGRLVEKQKGLDLLIKAFSLVNKVRNDWILKIVGDGSDKEQLIKNIKKYGLESNVTLIGRSDNVKKYYLESSIFLSTSRWEGFGLVITEAMECGLPVIAFDNSGPKEIINKNNINGILVPLGEINKLSEEIINLIDNYEKRKAISKEAIKRANDFSVESIIKEWNDIFNDIINWEISYE